MEAGEALIRRKFEILAFVLAAATACAAAAWVTLLGAASLLDPSDSAGTLLSPWLLLLELLERICKSAWSAEYSVSAGRSLMVLAHFLDMDTIYRYDGELG